MIISKAQKRTLGAGFIALIVLTIIFTQHSPTMHMEELEEICIEDCKEIDSMICEYGIPVEEYNVNYGIIKPNQNLGNILSKYGISSGTIHQISEASKEVFDVRKIRSGQAYATFTTRDSVPSTHYFVYEENAKEYIVYNLNECKVTRGQNPVEWKRREVNGSIESSLWNAMQKNDASPQLAVVLSHIFGWTIDFIGLQKEDEFRVIYEQEYVNGNPLLNFHILAASFKASDSLYYAIPFVQDDEELYYNEHGNSLEGAFLKAPLDFYRISSRFSNSRFHPVLKRYRAHHGVDYAAPTGTPVYTIGDGKIIAKGYQPRGGGYYLKVKHNGTYTTTYMHLSRFAKGMNVGKRVRQKEVIGYVGATGLATGPHLDFRVFENGQPINPLTIKSQPKKPVCKEKLPDFKLVCDSLIQQLRAL